MESVSNFLKRKAQGETQRDDPVLDFLRKKAGADDTSGAYTPGIGKSGRPGVVLTPQPSTERGTPAQTGRLRPGWDVSDAATAYQQAIRDTDSSLQAASGLSEIARTRQSPSAAAQTATDLESRMEQYSATMDNTQRNMGAMTPALQQARAGVDQRQREFDGYAQKLTMLQDTISNEKLDAKQRNDAIREYNALLPYAKQAAARLDNEVNTYNSLAGQAQQMEAQYNEALLNYQQALPEYDRISSRGNLDAKAFRSEGDKWSQRAKDLEAEANGTEALHPDFTRMTPEQVGEWQQNYFDLRAQAQEANARASEYRRQEEAAQKRYQNYQYNQLLAGVEKYQTDPNWDKLSRVDRSMMGGKVQYRNGTVDYGQKDIDYSIINGDSGVLSAWNGNNPIAMNKAYLTQMTDRERAGYNYLYAAKGKDAANDFLEKLTPALNERQRGANRRMWTEMAQREPWGTSAFSVLATPAKMISLFGQAIDLLDDGTIDQNAAYNSYSHIPADIRNAVSEQVEKKWGKAGSFVYQTGMSMADFLFQSAITGEFFGASAGASGLAKLTKPALLIMGSGAAADTVIELRDRGVDSTRAMALGTIAGLAEIVTENVSLENLLNPDKLADGVIRYILKNMAAEGSEELGSDVINWAADALYDLISGQDEAEWKYQIRQLQKEGMGVREATQKVALDMIKQAGLDALGGALSGGIMAGGGVGLNAVNGWASNSAIVADYRAGRALTEMQNAQAAAASMEEAPAPVESEAPIQEEAAPRTALEAALDKLSTGEQLTQNDAKRILNDPESVQALRDAGVMTGTIHNDSEGRQMVRQLVEQYAAQNRAQETQEEQQGDIPARTEETTESEAPGLRLKTAEETLTPPIPRRKLTLGNNITTEVTENGRQTEAPAPARAESTFRSAARAAAEGREVLDRSERRAGVGRLLQDLRNTRTVRDIRLRSNAAASLQNQAAARNLRLVSGQKLGVDNASDAKTVRILTNDLLTAQQRQVVEEYAKKGVQVRFMLGQIATNTTRKNGAPVTVRAWVSGDGKNIVVQADHPMLSWNQLLAHEELHRLIKTDPSYRGAVEKALLADEKLAPHLSSIIDKYTEAYREINPRISDDEIIEELLADYRAGFDMLDPLGLENPSTAKAAKMAAKDIQALEKKGVKDATPVPEKTRAEQTEELADDLETGDVSDGIKHSYESLGAAGGFIAVEKDGERYFVGTDGARIKQVTPEQIHNSPIGTLINYAASQGWLTESDARQQEGFFADILTMATKNQDFAMSMNMAGAVAFTAIKANSDHQYKTTYDFKSICIKTQAIINNMSAAMVAKKGALTKPEILEIYRATARDGLPVPCPECYVFSRWVGIGGLLDNIWKYQQRYGKMTAQEVVNVYNEISEKVAQAAEEKGITFGKAKTSIAQKVTKQYNDLLEKVEKADNQGEAVKDEDREKLKALESLMTDVKALTWIKDVYFGGKGVAAGNKSKNYAVPAEVLFDLNKGSEFVTNYPDAWGFRTTQGAGYGKAITPYAQANLGEGILGVANLNDTLKKKAAGKLVNPFLDARGEVSKTVKAKLEKAMQNERTQLFRGGQRFSSTSDMSNDVASDILISMLEMQSMHAGVQMYTKVDGAVGPLTLMGAYVNQSLMPLGGGLKNGVPVDTSVGGMNPEVARTNRNKYDRAGTITIGVNDNHIRALYQQIWRDFIIPYHASGGDANLVGEMRSVNDPDAAQTKTRSTDYTRTQGDKIMTDNLLRNLGKSEEEIERIHQVRAARIAILTGGKPDMQVVRSNPILSDLYDKFNGGEWDGVKLPKSEIEHFIYPNEFWDTTVDYEHSGRNTQLYLDYCEALGFLHRFSGQIQQAAGGVTVLKAVNGYDENGNKVPLTDLAYVYDENGNKTDQIEDFFWKLLVDRRMYGNDGKYLPQGAISLSAISTGDVVDFAKHNAGRQYNEQQSQELAAKVKDLLSKTGNNTDAIISGLRELVAENSGKASLEIDREYLAAVEAGEEWKAERMVRDAALAWGAETNDRGKPLDLYHGTPRFGFTKFDMNKETDSKGMIYTSTKREVSANYAGRDHYAGTRPIGAKFIENARDVNDIIRNAKTVYQSDYHVMTEAEKADARDKVEKDVEDLLERYNALKDRQDLFQWDDEDYSFNNALAWVEDLFYTVQGNQENFDSEEEYRAALDDDLERFERNMERVRDYLQEHYQELRSNDAYRFLTGYDMFDLYVDIAHTYRKVISGDELIASTIGNVQIPAELQAAMDNIHYIGAYHLYGNPGNNPVTIDAKEHDWLSVQAPEIMGDDKYHSTDAIAKKARSLGYTSITIKNVYDGGIMADDHIYFDANQVKSADPVTYDDDGNVIPLSERFNPDEEDIRFSIEIDPEISAQALQLTSPGRYTGGRRSQGQSPKKRVSRVRTHAFELGGLYNEVESQMAETQPGEFTYDPISEKRSMNEALGRLRKDFDGEAEKLASSDQWGGSDLDTAMGILYQYRQIGRETGDYSRFNEWSHVIQQKGTKGGQFVQAFAKYSRTATGVAQKAAENLRETAGKLNPKQQKLIEGHVSDILGAVDNDTEAAARDAVEKSKGKNGLRLPGGNDTQRVRDAENVIKQIHKIFSQQTRRSHGLPVEEWTKATGDQLAGRIASRLKDPGTKTQTTMQTILGDLITFAQEHALPTQEARQHRTALDRITDYLNNREAYAEAWGEAKQVLRDMYADDPEKLDALESFLNATITYNGDDFDRTMFRAILEASDLLGMDKQDILNLAAVGTTESVINRIADEFVRRVGVDDATLRDTVRRHIENIVREGNVDGRLERMESEASKELDIKIQDLLRESRRTKADAANRIAQYLINDLGISGTDAAIAANHIAGHYMDQLQQRADRVVERMFADKKTITKKQRDKLLDLIHLGGLTNANVEDAVVDALGLNKVSREKQRQIMDAMAQFADTLDAIEDNDLEGLRQLIREQAAQRGTRLSPLAEKMLSGETDAQYLRDFAMAQLDSIAADYAQRSTGEMISTFQTISHLLNMRTALRNVTANQVFDLIDSAANNVSMLPDMIYSLITGKRTVGLNKSWLSQAKRQGAVKGAGRNLLEVNLDVAVDDRQKSKYGTAGRRTWSMANSGTVGKILSSLEEVMGYELNTTDEFHKGSVMAETLESLARFVDRGDMTLDEAQEFAKQTALYRSFQDDSYIGAMLGAIKDALNIVGEGTQNGKKLKGKNVHDFGLGDFMTKYTQVPGALIHRAIEYTPAGYVKMFGSMASLAKAKHRGENTNAAQRRAALDFGRATTGSGLITLFAVLARAGLLRKDDKEDKNAKAMHQAQGFGGTQLNFTALERWVGGGDPSIQDGDVFMDLNFLEPLDSLMGLAALIASPDGLDLTDIKGKTINAVWDSISSLSMMQTLRDCYQVYQYYDENDPEQKPLIEQLLWELASSSITGFIPSPIRQLAQATDTTYRDQYRSQDISDQIRAKAMNSIPGLRQQLAPKITPLGEDKQYQAPALNALNALLNPGNISVYQTTDVIDELDRVYAETGDAKIWPERNAPYKTTINKASYTLTPDERTQYQRTRGQLTSQMMKAVMDADWYSGLDEAQKADVLNWIGNFSNYAAKVEFAEGRGMDYSSNNYAKYYDSLLSGTAPADVVAEAKQKTIAASAEASVGVIGTKKTGGSSGRGKTYSMADQTNLLASPSARMNDQDRELYDMEGHGGNVNLRTRKIVPVTQDNIDTVRGWGMDAEVGDYMTVASQTYRDGDRAVVVTPILPDGSLMTQTELDTYMDSLRGSNSYADADDRGIILGVFDEGTWQQNLKESDAFAERIHELHEEREEKRKTAGLKLPSTPERMTPISSGLKLQSTPAARPSSGGLRLK